MQDSPLVLFVWDNLTVYGGVRTFIVSCLEWLPQQGYRVQVADLHDGPVVLDAEALNYREQISLLPHEKNDSEQRYERRLQTEVARLKPDVVVFIEWRHAEDVMRCLPEAVPVINFCLVSSGRKILRVCKNSCGSGLTDSWQQLPDHRATSGNARCLTPS